MRAYSVDLRERIVEAVKEEKLSKVAVAERYQVSRASVHRYLGLEKQGSVEAKRLLYLPTYSPDFNPIEHLFAKIKAWLKKQRADTVPKLKQAFEDAVLTVTQDHAQNAFEHCGYLSQ